MPCGDLESGHPAHAVADHYGFDDPELSTKPRDVVGEASDRVRRMRLVAFAVPTEIDRHHTMRASEMIPLGSEVAAIAGPAVDQHDRSSVAGLFERKLHSVACLEAHLTSTSQVRISPACVTTIALVISSARSMRIAPSFRRC